MEPSQHKRQLRMIWPEGKPCGLPLACPDGYVLRQFREPDAENYLALMHEAGFTDFSLESLEKMKKTLLPQAFFLVEHCVSHELAATAMANHQPLDAYPKAGAVNWVAGSKKHSGRALGTTVVLAVLQRLLDCGYSEIYLTTDDFRLPALKTYLKIGFVPDLFADDMAARWQAIYEKLNWQV